MSATEVIEEIKKLSTEEQKKVRAFLLSETSEKATGNVDDRFEALADEVFEKNDSLFRKLAQ